LSRVRRWILLVQHKPFPGRRWIGAVRFTIGALQQILLKRQHTARIAYLPAEAAAAAAVSAAKNSDGASLSGAVPSGPPLPLLDALRAEAGADPMDALPQVCVDKVHTISPDPV
jgi:hypothetical protein